MWSLRVNVRRLVKHLLLGATPLFTRDVRDFYGLISQLLVVQLFTALFSSWEN